MYVIFGNWLIFISWYHSISLSSLLQLVRKKRKQTQIWYICFWIFNPYHAELYTQDITCMLNCFEEISQNLAFFVILLCSWNSCRYYLQEMMLVEYTLIFKTLETHFIMVVMATYFFPKFLWKMIFFSNKVHLKKKYLSRN